jgi:lipopolysaccharide biosynthesis glycosyltransferase
VGSEPLRVFIGYDPREAVAYHVCEESIYAHTSADVSIQRVGGDQKDGSNAFTYARFLVPQRCGFKGWALFLDGDMLVRGDIADLFSLATSHIGAMVVKHDYKTKHPVKYLGYKNDDYPRKNWSSVVLWNCGYYPNKVLTPEYVSAQPGSHLHRFGWLKDEQIGSLPADWNVLVREQETHHTDKLRHHTIGSPCFAEYAGDDPEWWRMYKRMIFPLTL